MKPFGPKPLQWYADPLFLIPIAIIVSLIVWTVFRELRY